MLIRDVILQLSLDSTSAVAVFTLSPFPQDCKTTNTHRENRHWKHRENCRRANWPSGETIWYQWEGLTCYLTAFNSWLVFPRVSHHVRRGKIAHNKWILATLYSFTHLKTKTTIKGTDEIRDLLQGQFPLYDTTTCEYSRLSSPHGCIRRIWYWNLDLTNLCITKSSVNNERFSSTRPKLQ